MKTLPLFALLAAAAFAPMLPVAASAQDIDSMPPVVVKTFPESGVKDVEPAHDRNQSHV